MHSIFAGIHIQNKTNEFLNLENIDFEKDVLYLKKELAAKLNDDANNLEIIYKGNALDDDVKLSAVIRPNGTIHCFRKTKKFDEHKRKTNDNNETAGASQSVQELFNLIAHIQINVNSRVNILQKILSEYPEFRRNLGAQALIRDSVLFNTLHQPEVIKNVTKNYPIIIEAAPFIVDVVKKELTRNNTASSFSEPATDSTNSSEEENSLGATSTSERTGSESRSQSENARIRMITRQQLQSALAQINFNSVNSLSSIAQRNTDRSTSTATTDTATATPTASATATATSSASSSTTTNNASTNGGRIPTETFRSELHRVLSSLGVSPASAEQSAQQMDITEASSDTSMNVADLSEDGSGDIPPYYRTHQYAEQLRTMAQMGFTRYEENLNFLNITNGNIENAINILMGAMN